jgi:glycosyltransferase involved in cell wall biosynthesis
MRIKVITQENKGLSEARNTGLKIANGEYISFIDSDDWVENTFIEMLFNSVESENTLISQTGRKVHYGEKISSSFIKESGVYNSIDVINWILVGKYFDVAVWDKLFHKSLFVNIFFPKGKINEDASIIFILIWLAKKVSHTGNELYHYRKREGSITSLSFNESKMHILENLILLEGFLLDKPIAKTNFNFYQTRLALYVYSLIIKKFGYIKSSYSDLLEKYLKRISKQSFFNPLNSLKIKLIFFLMLLKLYK